METRYLTKSLFKLAMECPTKLFYVEKKKYANNNPEDPFLEALSKEGFQYLTYLKSSNRRLIT